MATRKPRVLVTFEPEHCAALKRFAEDYETNMSALVAAIVRPISGELIRLYECIDDQQPRLDLGRHIAPLPEALQALYRYYPGEPEKEVEDNFLWVLDHLRSLTKRAGEGLGDPGGAGEDGATAPPAAASVGVHRAVPPPSSNTGVGFPENSYDVKDLGSRKRGVFTGE